MKLPVVLVASTALLSLAACSSEDGYTQGYGDEGTTELPDEAWQDYGNLDLAGGWLRGDIGSVRGLDEAADVRNGYGDSGYASFEVHGDNASGSAMNLLEVWGGLDALAPGQRATYRPADIDYQGEELGVQVIGCAGPSAYDWQYDQPADEVDVVVAEGDDEGTLRIEYTARTTRTDAFSGLPTGEVDVASGYVDVRP